MSTEIQNFKTLLKQNLANEFDSDNDITLNKIFNVIDNTDITRTEEKKESKLLSDDENDEKISLTQVKLIKYVKRFV